uniref:Uncharacterized protein n=1 Tax=Arundo donax TaxID=35708 RepID=A0A0A9A328_ARUDO
MLIGGRRCNKILIARGLNQAIVPTDPLSLISTNG